MCCSCDHLPAYCGISFNNFMIGPFFCEAENQKDTHFIFVENFIEAIYFSSGLYILCGKKKFIHGGMLRAPPAREIIVW